MIINDVKNLKDLFKAFNLKYNTTYRSDIEYDGYNEYETIYLTKEDMTTIFEFKNRQFISFDITK